MLGRGRGHPLRPRSVLRPEESNRLPEQPRQAMLPHLTRSRGSETENARLVCCLSPSADDVKPLVVNFIWADDKRQRALECAIGKDFAVNWDSKKCELIITPKSEETAYCQKDWKDICKENFLEYQDKYDCKKLPVESKFWDRMIKAAQDKEVFYAGDVAIHSKERSKLIVVGEEETVSQVLDPLRSKVRQMKEEEAMTSRRVNVRKAHVFDVIEESERFQNICRMRPTARFSLNRKRQTIDIEAQAKDISDIAKELKHALKALLADRVSHNRCHMLEESLNVGAISSEIMHRQSVSQHSKHGRTRTLQRQQSAWEETEHSSAAKYNDSITHDQPPQSSESPMTEEPSSSTPETFQMNKVTFDYLQKIRTTDLTECERRFGITVESDKTNCQAGAVSIFIKPVQGKRMHPVEQNKAFESVKALFQQMSQLNFEEEKIPFSSALFKQVSTATQLHPTSLRVLIEIDCSSSSGVISLIGPKKDLKRATHEVKKFLESLKSSHQPSSSPTYAQAAALPGKPVQVQVSLQEESENSMPNIFVKKGSITDEAVDVIVCSNDSHLGFSSGSAKAILKAGGKNIEVECRQYLHKYGEVCPGRVVITNAGDLSSMHVFHVVVQGMKISSSEPGHSLTDVFFECLLAAHKLGVKSIAFPALGCGVLGFKKEKCAETLLATVDRYWEVMQMTSRLQTILFVDPQEKVVKEFQKQLLEKRKKSSSVTAVPQTPASPALLSRNPLKKRKKEKLDPCFGAGRGASAPAARKIPGREATEEKEEDTCLICYSSVASKTQSCGHKFCKGCIDRWFKEKPVCPTCGAVLGKLTGTQPIGGTMSVSTKSSRLPGYIQCGTIQISYYIPSGTQTEKHPHPGKMYGDLFCTAYLPDNQEGNEVVCLLRKAFDARLTFTVVGTSGSHDQVTWDDIDHKICTHGGPQNFGYPDPGYLARVKDELKGKGIE